MRSHIFGQGWACSLILWWLPNNLPLMSTRRAGGIAFLSLVLFVFLLSMRRHSLYDHVVESAYALKSWENETFSIEPLDLGNPHTKTFIIHYL